MRNLRQLSSSVALVVALMPAACSSSSKASSPNGPVFGNEGGADVATDFPPDGATLLDAPVDHVSVIVTGDDTGAPPPRDAGDATTHADAGNDATSPAPDATAPAPDATSPAPDATSPAPDATAPLPDATSPHDSGGSMDAREDTHVGTGGGDASDAKGTAPSVCPSGSGTLAILGGTSTLAFGAVSVDGAAWKVTTFANGSVGAAPALIPYGGAFLGAYPRATTNYIESTVYSPAGWSIATVVPALAGSDAGATEFGTPGLAALGANGEIVYAGTNNKFYHGVYTGGAWGPASDPVGGAGTLQDYGPSLPSVAVVGSTLYVAYDGGNNGLYVDSWTASGGWAGAKGINGAGVGAVPPTLVALAGGTADLMLVYELQTTNVLYSVVHTPNATGGTWSAPLLVASVANSTSAVSLAPLANGGAVMAYKGTTNSFPYASIYNPTASPAWTVPAEIYAGAPALQAPPSVAGPTCGVDAIAALAESTGVQIVTLKNGVWSAPILATGTPEATYATLATE